jgi:DNA-binding MarR family transcriptional regulator
MSGVSLRASYARVLYLIGPNGTRQTELADGAWITKQAIGKRIREMAEQGLVSVDPDPDDGRATIVRRTTAGDQMREQVGTMIADVEAELASIVGADDYRTFRKVADQLATTTATHNAISLLRPGSR